MLYKNNIVFEKSNQLAHLTYRVTKEFPKEEIYGITSQIRRSALSVPLNIVEGFARCGSKSYKQFLLISYGSLQELKYLLEFSLDEGLLDKNVYEEATGLAEECARLLWKTIKTVKDKG